MADSLSTEAKFERNLIREYFSCGSINKVFQKYRYDLPISFAGYARLLTKYGVIKSAGPNSRISESLYLLSLLADYKMSLEKIYHRFAPQTVQVSSNTLHRILHYTRLGLTRRQGVALVITMADDPNMVLLGNDISLSERKLGNKGDLSLPMSHSKLGEPVRDSIARVLQGEVFTEMVVEGCFPWEVIPKHIKPFMYINIADIRVSVYKLRLPASLKKFSSCKIANIHFRDINSLGGLPLRAGVKEILGFYQNKSNIEGKTVFNSDLNTRILALAKSPAN